MTDYTVFDLETTGWGAGLEIIEIGALRVRGGVVTDTFQSLVKPIRPIDWHSSAVNHITDDMVKKSPSIETVLPDFAEFIGSDTLMGHNIDSFDMPIIRRFFGSILGREVTNGTVDTLKLARKRFDKTTSCSLENLSLYFGLDTEGEHRSVADCLLTKAVYDRLMEMLPDGSVHGIEKCR